MGQKIIASKINFFFIPKYIKGKRRKEERKGIE